MDKTRQYVNKFSEVIKENFNETDLDNFYHNITSMKIKKKLSIPLFNVLSSVAGYYDGRNNIICVKEFDEATINHELFHMASSVIKDDILYNGFYVSYHDKYEKSVGSGINEGYTELLNRRYMNMPCDVSIGYQYLLDISYCLERIIGKDQMQSFYMQADLDSVIKYLCEYSMTGDIENFFSHTDYLIKGMDKSILFQNKKKIIVFLKDVNEFLITTNAYKLLASCNEDKMSQEQVARELVKYNSLIVGSQTVAGDKLIITRQSDIDDCLKDVYKGKNQTILDNYKRLRIY